MLVRPLWFSIPKTLWIFGFRKSASINNTLLPSCAKVIAKLDIVVVLPSPGIELVITTDLIGVSKLEYCIFVLNTLYASDIGDFGFTYVSSGIYSVKCQSPFIIIQEKKVSYLLSEHQDIS